MAISFDVNLNIGSAIGFNMLADSRLIVNVPQLQTVRTLDGDEFTTSSYSAYVGPRLSIAPLSDFVAPCYNTSTRQTVYMTNIGDAVLTITNILYSYNDDIGPRIYYSTPGTTLLNSSTITINPQNTATFEIAYIGEYEGLYNNYFIMQSNNSNGMYYRVNTHQIIGFEQGFRPIPTSYSTTTNHIGEYSTFSYDIMPVYYGFDFPYVGIPVTGTISGSPAWTITDTGTNHISVTFNPNKINNVNGTYVSTLTIAANGVTHNVTNTATVNIDYDKNKHLSSWLSPASHYNSIIGISYDLIENVRCLTIGVGMGSDGSPIYGAGGNLYTNIDNLGLGAETVTPPYPFWANVYRMPFTGAAQTYTSNDYIIKTTEGVDYSGYFGEYGEPGSMFIVEDDGYGSLTVELNHLRELSGDTETDATLYNLTRAFHYYSTVDVEGRYAPLPPAYSSPNVNNTATTFLFVGFNYNTRDKLASVNTSIVDLPV